MFNREGRKFDKDEVVSPVNTFGVMRGKRFACLNGYLKPGQGILKGWVKWY